MNRTQIIHLFAGSMVLLSLAGAHWLDSNWLFLTVFVGLNLLQSSFTKWCLLESILIKLKVKGECDGKIPEI